MKIIRLIVAFALVVLQQTVLADDPTRTTRVKVGEAENYIPRNFVIGKDGKVKLASVGYTESDFQEIVRTIQKELEQ